ncbi:MAG: CHAT domain-containing protein [Cyanobacteria bacterium SBLK]|nr:CHAT domain-containing protein [Cyanobacteria bacterium SBLK]
MIVVELTPIGDLETTGFSVTVTVRVEGKLPYFEEVGTLPANPALSQQLQEHWSQYRNLGAPYHRPLTPAGFRRAIAACGESARSLVVSFQSWLQADAFRVPDRRLREVLNFQDDIRFLLRSDSLSLKKLPWHYWDLVEHCPRGEIFFCSPTMIEPQSGNLAWRSPQLTWHSPLRVLAILGHDRDIDVQSDRELLTNLPGMSVEFLVQPKRDRVTDELWERKWDILFFAGHSETKDEIGKLYLNQKESLTVEELRNGLKTAIARGLKLAIFNSCDGLGLAKTLSDLAIPTTIVMRELIPDAVAQAFLKYFLSAFSLDKPFHVILRTARERLEALEGQYPCASWMPVVVQHPRTGSFVLRKPFKLPPWRRSAIAALLLSGLVGWYWGFPEIARQFHRWGWDRYQAGELDAAGDAWEWALRFNGKNRATILMLGYLREKVGDFTAAEKLYRDAARRGQPVAYRKLAELAIWQKQDYDGAAFFAQQGLDLLQKEDDPARYNLLVYLARARLGQGQSNEAIALLEEALSLKEQPAKAYCVLGEVWSDRGENILARTYWEQCDRRALLDEFDEIRWRTRAREWLECEDRCDPL